MNFERAYGGFVVSISDTLGNAQDVTLYETGKLRLEQLPGGTMQVFRVGETTALAAFNGETGSLYGVDHGGDPELLAYYLHTAFGSDFISVAFGSAVGVGEETSVFDARGVSGGQAWVTVTDLDEDITIAVETSATGVDGWIRATPVAYENASFVITLSVAPFIRLAVTAANAPSTPTIAVTFTGNK